MNSRIVAKHHANLFGKGITLDRLGCKLGEESGETQGAIIRHVEFRDGRTWENEIRGEMMDVLVVLHVISNRLGEELSELVDKAGHRFLELESKDVEKVD